MKLSRLMGRDLDQVRPNIPSHYMAEINIHLLNYYCLANVKRCPELASISRKNVKILALELDG